MTRVGVVYSSMALHDVPCCAVGTYSALVTSSDVPAWDPTKIGMSYLYMAVADHIAARIASGDLPSGSRLPAEGDLADEYRVAVGTMRRATVELRERGLVATVPAKGTFVV